MLTNTRFSPPHSPLCRRQSIIAALPLVALLAGCGTTVYQPSAGFKFDLNPAAEINDAEIRAAFSLRPQMGKRLRVAYYTFDPDRIEQLEEMLRAQPGVEDVYRIPSLMVSGRRHFDRSHPASHRAPMSLKKLRLLAARARCDVVVVFDYSHRVRTTANGLAALNILLLPALFVPYLDQEVDSYLESFIVDTRNGYLYGQISSRFKDKANKVTIYSDVSRQIVDALWERLLKDTNTALGKLIESERSRPPVKDVADPSALASASS